MEEVVVRGVSLERKQAKITICGVADEPGRIRPPSLREHLDDEVIELADGNTGAQTVGSGQVDVVVFGVVGDLLG